MSSDACVKTTITIRTTTRRYERKNIVYTYVLRIIIPYLKRVPETVPMRGDVMYDARYSRSSLRVRM